MAAIFTNLAKRGQPERLPTLRSVPRLLTAGVRRCLTRCLADLQVAMRRRDAPSREAAWKLFLLAPRLLLARCHATLLITPRRELFESGQWEQLMGPPCRLQSVASRQPTPSSRAEARRHCWCWGLRSAVDGAPGPGASSAPWCLATLLSPGADSDSLPPLAAVRAQLAGLGLRSAVQHASAAYWAASCRCKGQRHTQSPEKQRPEKGRREAELRRSGVSCKDARCIWASLGIKHGGRCWVELATEGPVTEVVESSGR